MTLYDLLKEISYIIAENNDDKLFEYIIHSVDCNGDFLRSRYCYSEKALADFECGDDLKTVLVVLNKPFDFCVSTRYYENADCAERVLTLLKMQIFLCDLSNDEDLTRKITWSCAVGFNYPIKINLIDKSFEILPTSKLTIKPKNKIAKRNKKKLADFIKSV